LDELSEGRTVARRHAIWLSPASIGRESAKPKDTSLTPSPPPHWRTSCGNERAITTCTPTGEELTRQTENPTQRVLALHLGDHITKGTSLQASTGLKCTASTQNVPTDGLGVRHLLCGRLHAEQEGVGADGSQRQRGRAADGRGRSQFGTNDGHVCEVHQEGALLQFGAERSA
jgi:hypothetical protein